MKHKVFILISVLIVIALAQLACSLPGFSQVPEVDTIPEDQSVQQSDPSEPQEQNPPEQQPELEEGDAPETAEPVQPAQPQGGSSCNDGFIANANITNGQEFQPDDVFQVTWTIENTGDCTWTTDYKLKLLGGDIITAEEILAISSTVAPGHTSTLSVDMQAPSQPGAYISAWKMVDAQGHVFGQESPPNSPVKVSIKVIPSGGNNTPAPTPVPENNPEAQITGSGQTMLNGQCFDLNGGQEVNCSDSAADIMYQFTPISSGKFHGENNTELANNRDDEPDKAACEAQMYPPMAHSALEDKYFCFQISNIVNTTYGWIRVERFDQDGVTFDFVTFKADSPEVQPINPNALFVESQGDQVTMLTGECFDVQNGDLNESCSGIFAGFLYREMNRNNLTVMQISPNETQFSAAMTSEPTKSDCENASYSQAAIWPISETEYYCYQFTPGMGTYYGWLRPTSFDTNGLTFDYLTWKALP
ncbi:MAG: hypothetical protein ISR58_19650 [Anaerolineales bacterium]|nr:hypothetical protein [Chloroflexota bacterium]MBL6983400.1 hypothetical protein [Anaerolineales bacterium]